jgi:EAL domain-containing protein (putative c-di-GMP-specific phosphodiesterase class I)
MIQVIQKNLQKKLIWRCITLKNNGKNQYSFFCEEMNIAIQKRYKIEQAMRESIYQEDFYLEYQPFMSCGSDSVNTVEALIRWNHPSLGKVMPGEFISIAEENGMILKLGEWVFEKVCKDIDIFKRYNIQKISINISPKQLMDCNFVLNIEELIKKYKIETSLLEFEITETILMDTSGIVVDNLNRLKELGITFALDDFGTGYSSLNYIKHFSVDTIKIDKSFINTMCHDEKDMAIVNTIIYLSNVLDKNIVAEGVETTEQLEHFKDHKKCNIQGYLFSKPLGLDSLTHMLENNKL